MMNQGMDELPRVAVIQLPGVNCEYETQRILTLVGLHADIVRWNRPASEIESYDGYVIPGGFAYQDRIRAGAIAAKIPALDSIARGAEQGKPVLGLCNGAQVLVEAGLVPGTHPGKIEMGLAPNRGGWDGYYCDWVYVKVFKDGRETAFTSRFEEGEIIPVPMAHGEGRFVTKEDIDALAQAGQIPLRYVSPDGDENPGFPYNPNGAMLGAAGVTNPEGNVLAFMPHPERSSWLRQVPENIKGVWGEKRRSGSRQRTILDGPGPGYKFFQSLAEYLEWGKQKKEVRV
jgi:phosphoribosylformylglycinamidine synthase I